MSDTSPDPTDELQPFLSHPTLARELAFIAVHMSGVSLTKWNMLLDEINKAITCERSASSRRVEELEKALEKIAAYEPLTFAECADAEAIIGLAKAALSTTPATRLDERKPQMKMSDAQIKHMVDRFLGWKLPSNFSPDAGITFKAAFNEHTSYPMKHEPSGTNLFDATQADAMVRYLIDGMPEGPATRTLGTPDGWKLVPRDPSPEMMAEIENNYGPMSRGQIHPVDFWQHIYDAAPEAITRPATCPVCHRKPSAEGTYQCGALTFQTCPIKAAAGEGT